MKNITGYNRTTIALDLYFLPPSGVHHARVHLEYYT